MSGSKTGLLEKLTAKIRNSRSKTADPVPNSLSKAVVINRKTIEARKTHDESDDDVDANIEETSVESGLESAESNETAGTPILKRRAVRLKTKVNRQVENWKLPDLSTLDDPPATRIKIDKREIEEKAQVIVDKLSRFDVGGEVVAAKPGPAVTLFEFRPNGRIYKCC